MFKKKCFDARVIHLRNQKKGFYNRLIKESSRHSAHTLNKHTHANYNNKQATCRPEGFQ